MLTKFLCKAFKLISRQKMKEKLRSTMFEMSYTQSALKKKYDTNEISEWSYYKKLWKLMGRLSMLEEVIKMMR